jgi:hypothetical protein
MRYFKFLIGKILNWILNLTAPTNPLSISIKEYEDEIFIENHLGYAVFLNEKFKKSDYQFDMLYKEILSNLDQNKSIFVIGKFTSIEFIKNLDFFNGKIYIIEFSKSNHDLQFRTINLLDQVFKSKIILFHFDIIFDLKNQFKVDDFISEIENISLVRINDFITLNFLFQSGSISIEKKPIIVIQNVNFNQFLYLNFNNLLLSNNYFMCLIQINDEYHFLRMDELNVNTLLQKNIADFHNYDFSDLNLFIYTERDKIYIQDCYLKMSQIR